MIKKINSNNKFMFVIKNLNGTHLWLFSKMFNKKYSSSVWYVQFKERKNLIDLPYINDQFLFLKHIFLFSVVFQFLV